MSNVLPSVLTRDDGSLRPNFKSMPVGKGFTAEDYALGVYRELRQALKCLGEEK